MVDYGWPTVKNENMAKKLIIDFFSDFYIAPGGPGSHPGGSRTDSGAEKHQNSEKINFLYFFVKKN